MRLRIIVEATGQPADDAFLYQARQHFVNSVAAANVQKTAWGEDSTPTRPINPAKYFRINALHVTSPFNFVRNINQFF
ncbi:MAG: hypothetical protein WCO53_00945 [Deltaproteobacteria bacterium]